MTILITGGGGFVGSHLMDVYPDAVGFDNFLTGRRENNSRVIECDITQRHHLYELANETEPDVVIHCAASYSNPDLWHRDTDTNVSGCINAAAVAKHHGAHLIYFQTILPPTSSYAISKIAGEQYLRLSGVPLTVLRLGNIYGPRNISGPIPVFYKRLTQGQPVTVVDTTRDMVFIEDLVRAVEMVIEHQLAGTYDVCSGVQTTILAMYEEVSRNLGISELASAVPPLHDDVQGTVDPENGVPLWAPVVSLRDGIEKTVAAYREDSDFPTHTHLRLGTDAS
jgi:UDP-glucose 4-epimerase